MKQNKSLATDGKRKKRRVLIGCAIGGVAVIGIAVGLIIGLVKCSPQYHLTPDFTTLDENNNKAIVNATKKGKDVEVNEWTITPKNINGITFKGPDNNHQATLKVDYSEYDEQSIDRDFNITADFGNGHKKTITITVTKKDSPHGTWFLPWSQAKQYFIIGSHAPDQYPDLYDTITGVQSNGDYRIMKNCIAQGYHTIEFGNDIKYIGTTALYAAAMFTNGSPIQHIIFSSSEMNVGNNAFFGCSGLISIYLTNNTIFSNIGYGAFASCNSFTGFTDSDMIIGGTDTDAIGAYAFSDCPLSLNFLQSIAVQNPCFKKWTDNSSYVYFTSKSQGGPPKSQGGGWLPGAVDIPDFDPSADNAKNYGCLFAGDIPLSDTVVKIGVYAFMGCAGITSIVLTDSVTLDIELKAFQGCSKLTEIVVPSGKTLSIASIGQDAFAECPLDLDFIKRINPVTPLLTYYAAGSKASSPYCFIAQSGFVLGTSPANGVDTGCLLAGAVPINVTTISDYAFYMCGGLTSASLPANTTITEIDAHAFTYCTRFEGFNATNLRIGGTTPAAVGASSFVGCPLDYSFINNLTIDNPLLEKKSGSNHGEPYCYIAKPGFVPGRDVAYDTGCGSLMAGAIPIGTTNVPVTRIGGYAFMGCAGITYINLSTLLAGNSQDDFAEFCFRDCTNLKTFDFN